MGLYSPATVTDIADVRSWTEPGDGPVQEKLDDLRAQCNREASSFAWVGLFEPTRAELDIVQAAFELPHLQVEDASNPLQRPKVERVGNHVFAIVKVLDYLEGSSDVRTGQLAIFIGKDYVVTVRYGQIGDLRPIRERLASEPNLRTMGPMGVLYATMDLIVDDYLTVCDAIAQDIEEVEVEVFEPSTPAPFASQLYRLKRENIEIRRAISPLVPWAHSIVSDTSDLVPEALHPYFRDMGEHLLRANDSVESSDNLLMSLMMVSTSMQDLQQNRDMRKISAWVAIAAVPTMIAGIYGMNFDQMPELHQAWGYPAVLALMGGACFALYRAFKRSGWL